MTALIIILCVLFLLLAPLFINFHLILSYDDEISVRIRVLFFSFNPFKLAEKLAGRKPHEKKKTKKSKEPEKEVTTEKKKGDITGFLSFVTRLVKTAVSKMLKHLKIEIKELSIAVASEDAAKTALMFGAISGMVANLDELMRQFLNYRTKRDAISVTADYLAEKTRAKIKIIFTVKPIFMLTTAVGVIAELFRNKRMDKYRSNLNKNKKEGLKNERNTAQTNN